jgi:ferritin
MFINQTVQDAINEQIKHELYSAYLYLAMAAHFNAESLSGFASWTRKQAEEEVEHAMKLFDFVNDRGGKVVLQAIDQPPNEFGSPLEVFEEILKHEQKVTSLINTLYEISQKQNDYATQVMLHWFIEEQVEEEDNASGMVDKLKLAGNSVGAILQLDREASSRSE